MRITVLGYLDKERGQIADCAVGQVADALRHGGHRVSVLGVHDDLRKLIAGLNRRQPELVFNLLRRFGDSFRGASTVIGALDLIGIPYTAAGPGEHYLQEDRALTRRLLAFDEICSPNFAVLTRDTALESVGGLHMPLRVKPLRTDVPSGVGARPLVYNTRELLERIAEIHDKANDAALVEEAIEGRDLCVGVLGNLQPMALPPLERDETGLSEDVAHRNAASHGTRAVVTQMPDAVRTRLQQVALNAYQALRVRDYGRIDLRLTETGEIYVVEVNANCSLEKSSELASAAAAHGIDYIALVNRVAELAAERHRAGDHGVSRPHECAGNRGS